VVNISTSTVVNFSIVIYNYYIAEIARVFDASENTGVVTAFR